MEAGLLCIKGPNVTGYQLPKLNETAFFPSGWFNTGDWAYQNEEGYVWILGRQADFIPYKGKYISLLEIETILHQHPKIKIAATISMLDMGLDAILRIYVILHEDVPMMVEEVNHYINNLLREKYGPLHIDIKFCNQLPINGMGKVLKYILKEELFKQKNNTL
jgi:acyl-coenzyme A synthetase/AMP-(fatty) acid ligase